MRRPILLSLVAAGLLCATAGIASSTRGKTVSMPFAECEAIIDEVASDLGVEPIVLASDGNLRKVRIDAADGFITVSCDRAQGTMSLSKTAPMVTASR